MKRIASAIAVLTLAITLIVTSLQPAEATHTLAHLRRQIARLENQVANLQQQLKGLNSEVFNCEVFDSTTPHTFSDGTIGYPLYERSTCAA
jgi:peptidoglycan hydrolase CwlO-like protein